ncbi:hypothetical protein HK105_201516 [Polyrhizophydium stewartii]|uniref:Bidirectional sugar transporter SWEET n=1 Tax=Polyrhizophydium stewartii TaxID=2732419 RepID=A0ABR4NGM2_9FUNG
MADCDTDQCRLLLHHVVPGIGVLTALWIFVAPLASVRGIQDSQSIGAVNPLPFPMIVANCLCWLVYGLLVQDPYVFGPNIAGYQLGLYYTLTAYNHADAAFRSRVLTILVASSLLVFSGGFISFIVLHGQGDARTIMGSICVVILAVFYSAPLSTVRQVIKRRDSSPIDLTLAIASIANSSLWTVYGFAVSDGFIWGPNLLGVVFGAVQFGLMAIFPRRSSTLARLDAVSAGGGRGEEARLTSTDSD